MNNNLRKIVLLAVIAVVVLAGAGIILLNVRAKTENQSKNVSKDNQLTDVKDVAIYYGYSSWAMFGADDETKKLLYNMYQTSEMEPTGLDINVESQFTISFTLDGEQIRWIVDKNGIVLDEEGHRHQITNDSFNYETIKSIYKNSKTDSCYKDGIYDSAN
ncbi:hypothetical protein [Anaeromicropila populeti]|uniref:Uncharacterized protein n=1 Tax=Anaeromicropila populeti TaxID=37658 RepID=A0A1I6HY81_9FIRM|nr:hypothetical protein [Anaeromicropila populeti]SFR59442.1 hypothetical protein SAMN05661086_00398 [Anaeromicropila populeti]